MKYYTRLLLAALFAVSIAFILLPVPAFAQAAADSTPALVAPETAAAIATPFIVTLSLKYPVLLTVLAVMGGLRFFFKPIVSLVETYVRSTPATNDDELYARATHSRAFRLIAWALDFFASVKVGPQFTATPAQK